jgi:hypothetical protein
MGRWMLRWAFAGYDLGARSLLQRPGDESAVTEFLRSL